MHIYIYIYIYIYPSICLSAYLYICPDSSVDFSVWTEFSGCVLKSHSSELSIATPKNLSLSIWQSCDYMCNFRIKISVHIWLLLVKRAPLKDASGKRAHREIMLGGGGVEDRRPLCPRCSRGPKIDHVIVIWPIEWKKKWHRNRSV